MLSPLVAQRGDDKVASRTVKPPTETAAAFSPPLGNTTLERVARLQRSIGNRATLGAMSSVAPGHGAHSPTGAEGAQAPRIVGEVLRGSGQPLDASTLSHMEPLFGTAFRDVRVHSDAKAAASARAVSAQAYTAGQHVVFNEGRYAPHSAHGRQLLAHELTHTIQQRGVLQNMESLRVAESSGVDAAAESKAQAIEQRVASGTGNTISRGAPGAVSDAATGVMEASSWGIARKADVDISPTAKVEVTGNVLKVEGIAILVADVPTDGNARFSVLIDQTDKQLRISIARDASIDVRLQPGGLEQLVAMGYTIHINDQTLPGHETHSELEMNLPPWPGLRTSPRDGSKPKHRPVQPTGEERAPITPTVPAAIPAQPALPPAATLPVPQAVPPTADDLIGAHTDTWGLNLDEESLGAELLARSVQGQAEVVDKVFDQLDSSDRDDVALAFAEAAGDDALVALTRTPAQRVLLDRLIDELTDGEASADEKKQAERIRLIKTRETIPSEQWVEKVAKAKESMVLPFRKTGLTVLTPSPIFARRLPGGQVAFHLSVNAGSYYTDADIKLPPFYWNEIILQENDVVGIKCYDEGGKVEFVPAIYLVQLSNEGTTVALHKVGEAAALGFTLGTSSLEVGGGEAVSEATTAGTLGRVGAYARTGVVWADRIAMGLDVANTLIQEHRGWIIETWGGQGRAFVNGFDELNGYAQIYGILRAGYGVGKLSAQGVAGLVRITKNLRVRFDQWRTAARAIEGQLSSDEIVVVERMVQETEKVLKELEDNAKLPDAPPLRAIEGEGLGSGKPTGRLRAVAENGELPPLPEGNAAQQIERVEDEVEQIEQQQIRAASGDPGSEGAMMEQRGGDTTAVAGGGSKKKLSVVESRPKQTTTNVTGQAKGRGPNTLPEPHPNLPKAIRNSNNYSVEEIFDFYKANKSKYPAELRNLIDAIPETGLGKTAMRARLVEVDAVIRELHTDAANRALGYANKVDKPFLRSVKGSASNEGSLFSQLVTDEKDLTLIGQLKSGGIVEFDSVEFQTGRLIETKMNLDFKSEADVFDQMKRQADFARDWGFGEVRWNLWGNDEESLRKATEAWNELARYDFVLAHRIKILGPNQPW